MSYARFITRPLLRETLDAENNGSAARPTHHPKDEAAPHRRHTMNQPLRTKLLAALFVPALALAAGAASAAGDTSKVTGQSATNGSTNTDKGTAQTGNTAGMASGKTSTASDAFARLDANHDGKLSAAEGAMDPKVKAMWKKLDANNDGTVSEAEFAAHQSELK
jgi:hypothetical protein